MRVLWLNAGLLLPLDKGGKLRTWHLMRHLAARHEVTYLSFAEPGASSADLAGMREVCSRLETVPRREVSKGSAAFYLRASRFLLDPAPYAVAAYRSAQYRARAAALLADGAYDAVVCDFLVPAVNLPRRLPCPAVLFTHNVEAEIWRRHAETAATAWRRALMRSQWRRMLRFEGDALARFEMVLAVSDADRDTLARLYGGRLRAPVRVIPTGVDARYFAEAADLPYDSHRLAFTGSMDWLPNEDAVLYFGREILPEIRKVEPRVTLSIIGRNPTPAVHRLAAEVPGIEITGRVEDVRPHVARASLSIVPLRIGGGTRLKIYEAMAMGRPVVSTSVGAEGLPLVAGRDLEIADGPRAFAARVLSLLSDPAARQRMADAARRLVVERYDWSAVAGTLEEAIHAAATGGLAKAPVPQLLGEVRSRS
ncbi:MAG: glycosyltransferase [Acidobacteria bacterium]|nr:glycosyltransferase [Acidobacteriota bacterium]